MIILRNKDYSKKGSIVYLLVGLPGSGKSTWSKKYHPNLPIVFRDIIRYKLGYTSGPNEKAMLSNYQENKITRKEYKIIEKYLKTGQDNDFYTSNVLSVKFIIDDTNLRRIYREPLINLLHKFNAYVIGVNFQTPLKVCIERRKDQIPKEALINLSNVIDKLKNNEVDKIIYVRE